jgi:pimeloyl-ACP methyl ester carboxylesterase
VAAAPDLGELPLAVLSATDAPPSQMAEHERAARQSRRGEHRVARQSGHWIPLEEPELVIEAVRNVVAAAAEVRYNQR